jgi:hypothetical protein
MECCGSSGRPKQYNSEPPALGGKSLCDEDGIWVIKAQTCRLQ